MCGGSRARKRKRESVCVRFKTQHYKNSLRLLVYLQLCPFYYVKFGVMVLHFIMFDAQDRVKNTILVIRYVERNVGKFISKEGFYILLQNHSRLI